MLAELARPHPLTMHLAGKTIGNNGVFDAAVDPGRKRLRSRNNCPGWDTWDGKTETAMNRPHKFLKARVLGRSAPAA
jgi:hypothetical protein